MLHESFNETCWVTKSTVTYRQILTRMQFCFPRAHVSLAKGFGKRMRNAEKPKRHIFFTSRLHGLTEPFVSRSWDEEFSEGLVVNTILDLKAG